MKLTAKLQGIMIKALTESMPVDLMVKIAQKVVPDYDLYDRSGFPSNIPMPRADAARWITNDIKKEGLFFRLTETLIEVHRDGLMGREISIRLLPQIISEIESQGFRYNENYGVFIESEEQKKTMGWGTLRNGKHYEFALLRMDIAGNSKLVRRYPGKLIARTYTDVERLVTRIVEKREGRIWNWEGDGGLGAFYFSDKNVLATLCGIEILQELFLYNLLQCRLNDPVQLRMALHTGPCQFLTNTKDIHSDTITRVEILESKCTEPNSLTVSPGVYTDLGGKLASVFEPFSGAENTVLYRYSLGWEQ